MRRSSLTTCWACAPEAEIHAAIAPRCEVGSGLGNERSSRALEPIERLFQTPKGCSEGSPESHLGARGAAGTKIEVIKSVGGGVRIDNASPRRRLSTAIEQARDDVEKIVEVDRLAEEGDVVPAWLH